MCSKKILSTDEAYPYISPYVELINRLIINAVDSYKEIPPLHRFMDSARTRSSSISDRILWNISNSKELLEDDNIKMRKRYSSLRILVKDRVQLVFKKLNNNLMPSRPSSPRSLNYLSQRDDIQKEFPEISESVDSVTNLYWGYIWNPLGDPRTPIVCLDGSQLLWHFEFVEPTKEMVKNNMDKIDPQPPNNETKRIRPKGQRKNRKKTGSDINGEEPSQN